MGAHVSLALGYGKIHPSEEKYRHHRRESYKPGEVIPWKTEVDKQASTIMELEINDNMKFLLRWIGYGISDADIQHRVNEELIKTRDYEHSDPYLTWYHAILGEYETVKDAFRLNKELLKLTDCQGTTLCHWVFLHEHYDLAHYLIENYPVECVIRASAHSTITNIPTEYMPYTGETILHIAIIRRDIYQVRWILDFYKQRKHLLIPDTKSHGETRAPNGLEYLLRSRTTGRFFSIENNFYMGETPLHFAACCNDTHIFDLVLSYSSIETPDSLFTRDSRGNTILHLCVIRGHQKMFSHVIKKVKAFLQKMIRNAASEQEILIKKDSTINRLTYFKLHLMREHGGTTEAGFSPKVTLLQLPMSTSPGPMNQWVEDATELKFAELMSEVLNADGHSLLTLAAKEKKIEMFEHLIRELKNHLLKLGPQTLSYIDLDGFEQPHQKDDYDPASTNDLSKIKMYGAVEWLCIVNSQRQGDDVDPPEGFSIQAVQQLIESKWDRCGKALFIRRWTISVVILILVTIMGCVADADPSFRPGDSYASITLLYLATAICMMILFLSDIPYLHKFPLLRGAPRIEKGCGMVMVFSFAAMCIIRVVNFYNGVNVYVFDDQTSTYSRMDSPGIEIPLAICMVSSWLNMYYYLMGFNSTGPFVLKIFTIVSKDVPYFLRYYAIGLIGLSTALSSLGSDGNPANGAGFYRLLLVIWTLFKFTVGGGDDYNVLNMFEAPQDVQWLFDVIMILFRIAGSLLMINILIGIIGNTYSAYGEVAYQMLLMEKYNIMCAQALFDSQSTGDHFLLKYAIKKQVLKCYDEARQDANDEDIWYFKLEETDKNWWDGDDDDSGGHADAGDNAHIKNVLVIVDAQNSFHPANQYRPQGSLAVIGANEDSARIASLIRENINAIDEIYVSLDTHNLYDIGHSIFWVDHRLTPPGPPAPFTVFGYEEIAAGLMVPANDPYDRIHMRVLRYAKDLAAQGIPKLVIWPDHCIIGTQGHSVVYEINEALQEWAETTRKEVIYIQKGTNPYTEMYSALSAAVEDPADKSTALNTEVLGLLKVADKLFICGQALSHSVNYTCRDLVKHIDASKLYLLEDGTSMVQGFEKQGESFKQWFIAQGGNCVKIAAAFGPIGTSASAVALVSTSSDGDGVKTTAVVSSDTDTSAVWDRASADWDKAFAILKNQSNSLSYMTLTAKLENLGVDESADLSHLEMKSLVVLSKHLKEAKGSQFLANLKIPRDANIGSEADSLQGDSAFTPSGLTSAPAAYSVVKESRATVILREDSDPAPHNASMGVEPIEDGSSWSRAYVRIVSIATRGLKGLELIDTIDPFLELSYGNFGSRWVVTTETKINAGGDADWQYDEDRADMQFEITRSDLKLGELRVVATDENAMMADAFIGDGAASLQLLGAIDIGGSCEIEVQLMDKINEPVGKVTVEIKLMGTAIALLQQDILPGPLSGRGGGGKLLPKLNDSNST